MFDLYVSFIELALVVDVCRTKLFALKKQGHLSPTPKVVQQKKRPDLVCGKLALKLQNTTMLMSQPMKLSNF